MTTNFPAFFDTFQLPLTYILAGVIFVALVMAGLEILSEVRRWYKKNY